MTNEETQKQQFTENVAREFCNYLGHSQPAVCRDKNQEGVNIFINGRRNAKIELKNRAAEIVDSSVQNIGIISMNYRDPDTETIMNLSLVPDETGTYYPVTRDNGAFWCCALVETQEENAAELAKTLRDNDIIAVSLDEAKEFAEKENEDADEVLQALADYVQNPNDPAARLLGSRRKTFRYNLNKMLVLFERSGAPSQDETIWTNVAKATPSQSSKLDNALDQE